MNKEIVEQADQSVLPGVEPVAEPVAPASISDHAKQFSPQAQKEAAAEATAGETAEQKAEREHHSAQQRRDKQTGEFAPGKTRHRAQSQQAKPEDAPRIQQLTARAKTAEERLGAAEAELARLRTQHAPAAQIATAERKVEQAGSDPEPNEDDPKYGGDYGKYLRDVTKWETRQAIREEKTAFQAQQDQQRIDDARTTTLRTFNERIVAAQEKYEDFNETLRWDAPWLSPAGQPYRGYEALHAFILEDDAGTDVLQYLRLHPNDVDAVMRVPPLQQVKWLTLLGQRFASSPSEAAGSTRAAPGRSTVVTLPHRPPTLVRTEAQRAGDSPPPTDGSLSIDEHRKAFAPTRR